MRIAQIAPLMERVPPPKYGGTERVVHNLTEELVRRGHEVVLYASGDSLTSAELRSPCPRSLRMADVGEQIGAQLIQLGRVYREAGDFDVIHSHVEQATFPAAGLCPTPILHTIHSRLDLPHLPPVYRHFMDQPLISISNAQREPMPWANWLATVYHGLPLERFPFYPKAGDYLVYVSRIAPEKQPHEAIELCLRLGVPLKVAGKVDRVDRNYFEEKVKPLLSSSLVEFIGEITGQERNELMGGALGFLFPLDWPEPFGLVVVESLAVGTPVITRPVGSVPELMVDGVTGFLCESLEEMAARIPDLAALDRRACRRHVEENFSTGRMADGYEAAYARRVESRNLSPLLARRVVARQ